MAADGEQLNQKATQTLFDQLFNALFSNLERYLAITKHIDPEPLRLFTMLDNSESPVEQDAKNDMVADQAVMIEELGGKEAAQKALERDEITNWLKFNKLSKKAIEFEKAGKADSLC